MEEWKSLIQENKRVLMIGLVIVLLFIGFSVTQCVSVHTTTDSTDQEEQVVDESETTDGDPDAESDESDSVEDQELTNAQQELYDNYDDETVEFVNYLAANLWTAKNDSYTLRFSGTAFEESYGDETASVSYVVSALEKNSSSSEGENGENATTTTYSAAILTDSGTTYLLTLRQYNGAGESDASVTSSAFSLCDSYSLSEASLAVSVTGLNSSFDEQIDGKSSELTDAIADYCAQYHPTATSAEWSKLADIDYEANTVTTSFTLNTASKTILNVVYSHDSGEFEIS